jgi:hypothetical protein
MNTLSHSFEEWLGQTQVERLDPEPFSFSGHGLETLFGIPLLNGLGIPATTPLAHLKTRLEQHPLITTSEATAHEVTLTSHHHVHINATAQTIHLSAKTWGAWTVVVPPHACVSLDVSDLSSGFLTLDLGAHSQATVTSRSPADVRFLMVRAKLQAQASLRVDDRWQGRQSWLGFHGTLASSSSIEHHQRLVVHPGQHTCAAEFVVPPHVKNASIEQSVKVIKTHPDAKVDLRPWLWIGHREVAAKHGAAIGQVDLSAQRYLQARGLSEEDSRQLLIDAFLGSRHDD